MENLETMKNITDKLEFLKNETKRQWGLIHHTHGDAIKNIHHIYNLDYDVEQIINYVSISNWIKFEGACYYISNSIQKTNWNSSSKECKKLNENAEISMKTSEEQNKFISYELWIGGVKKDEQWIWKDDTNMTKGKFNKVLTRVTSQIYHIIIIFLIIFDLLLLLNKTIV